MLGRIFRGKPVSTPDQVRGRIFRKMLRSEYPASRLLAERGIMSESESKSRVFRAVALERAASPEQLDHLVGITKPADWIFGVVIVLALATAITWSIVGRIPTRTPAEGILISGGGRVVDAVSSAPGRLAALEIGVGDRVAQGQVVARIA